MESTAVEVPLPNYWEPWDYTRQSLHTVELKESDNEFKEVFSHFRASIHYLDSRRSMLTSLSPRMITFTCRLPTVQRCESDPRDSSPKPLPLGCLPQHKGALEASFRALPEPGSRNQPAWKRGLRSACSQRLPVVGYSSFNRGPSERGSPLAWNIARSVSVNCQRR